MSVSPVFQTRPDFRGVSGDRRKRVYLEVFGCQMNKLDAELMLATLLENGYSMTDDIDAAGVVLYVTCSVRQQAENRVFSKIGRLRERKTRERDFVIALMGCMAQNQPEETRKRFPYLDIICGTAEFLRLPALIEQARTDGAVMAVDLDVELRYKRRQNLGPRRTQAYVSVMRGCDMVCTFCIVPRTRGREISKPIHEVVDEVRALVDDGVREVTLLGQTVNSYGKRLAPGRRIGLHHLLHQLDKISGLDRIRFITSHPSFMSADLIDAMGSLEKVCEYLHLPIQSGDDAVLKRMKRGYTVGQYRAVVEACRERIPGFRLATDFIVGFPGESDAAFESTCRVLEEFEFQNSFVFKYSPRPQTPAHEVADDVPTAVKQERNQRLLEIQKDVSSRVYAQSVGGLVDVLVEGPSRHDPDRYTGRNRAYQICVFPVAPDEGERLVGQILPVRIDRATHLTLQGELASRRERKGARPSARSDDGSGEATLSGILPIESLRLLDSGE